MSDADHCRIALLPSDSRLYPEESPEDGRLHRLRLLLFREAIEVQTQDNICPLDGLVTPSGCDYHRLARSGSFSLLAEIDRNQELVALHDTLDILHYFSPNCEIADILSHV